MNMQTDTMPLLQVKNINQFYGGSHILRDVSFEAHLGRITVLLGRNGVGKTTLLKSLMGAVPIRDGSISFNGQAIEKAAPYERARAGIGYVPQGREIFARLTVEDNLRMGLATQPAGTDIPAELFEHARWPQAPSCWYWTNRRRAFSPASSKTLAA